MIDPTTGGAAALGLILLLGLRHGLDPDHIAVIDNLTFRAADERPRWAPWTGTLFAIGHSLSVAVVAIGVSWLAADLTWPSWAGEVIDWLVIGLLILVGVLNLRALRTPGPYVPQGWRTRLVPRVLRDTSHPLGVIGVGVIFGLVFDTATQAAAWGLAATSSGGVAGAAMIAGVFAVGMIVTDTIDSQIVARLLRVGGDVARVRRYRRAVGWLIVTLSFAMAAYSLLTKFVAEAILPDPLFTTVGIVMAASVVALLVAGRAKAGEARA